jgi:N-formylglutamate deformylase
VSFSESSVAASDDSVEYRPGAAALVLDSPHSGQRYPADFNHACERSALRVAEDTHVQALWDFAAAMDVAMVQAHFPRSYIDANRSLQELDPSMLDAPWPGEVTGGPKVRLGKGLIWRCLDDGTPIYDRLLSVGDVRQRVERCWRPYHDSLEHAVAAARSRHGFVLHLNCHSMPAMADDFSTDHPGLMHADFVLGDRDGTSADPRLTRWIERFLNSRGFEVSVNHPYKGVEIVRRHGRPREHQHSIQLEVNKRLYMDETTFAMNDGFPRVQGVLRELAAHLLEIDPRVAFEPRP